jgi:hypothetical protein
VGRLSRAAAILLVALFAAVGIFDSAIGEPIVTENLPDLTGRMITIEAYNEGDSTFTIVDTELFGQGAGKVTKEGLANAVDAIDVNTITQDPQSIVGKQFKCDHFLKMIQWEY